jgi:hypothetical protein
MTVNKGRSSPSNYAVNATVRPVTPLAVASVAPVRPAPFQGQQATFTFDGEDLAGGLESRTARRLIREWCVLRIGPNWTQIGAG